MPSNERTMYRFISYNGSYVIQNAKGCFLKPILGGDPKWTKLRSNADKYDAQTAMEVIDWLVSIEP